MFREKPKILVVDDDPQMLSLLGEVLASSGAEPVCLQSSQDAAQRIQREKFDAFFLDWIMPEINGLQLAEKIRWSKSNSRCPIVVITGNTEPKALKESFRMGANFFLHKPVTVERVVLLLNATRGMILHERRRYQRAPFQTDVVCTWQIQDFKQKTRGQTVDLSASGLLARLEVAPEPNTPVTLHFTLPADPDPLVLDAAVVRVMPDQQVGLRFFNLGRSQFARIAEFVERRLREKEPRSYNLT